MSITLFYLQEVSVLAFSQIKKNNHWVLFVACIPNRRLIYIDPLSSTEGAKKGVFDNWKSFCKSRSLENIEWTSLDIEHVLQTDGFN